MSMKKIHEEAFSEAPIFNVLCQNKEQQDNILLYQKNDMEFFRKFIWDVNSFFYVILDGSVC